MQNHDIIFLDQRIEYAYICYLVSSVCANRFVFIGLAKIKAHSFLLGVGYLLGLIALLCFFYESEEK